MQASSAAPTIAENRIARIDAPDSRAEAGQRAPRIRERSEDALSWKTYSWGMRSVWLENILLHQPKRWLPEKYPSYDELLAAAVEAAVNDPEAPKDLLRGDGERSMQWKSSIRSWARFRCSTLVRARTAGAIGQRIHGKSGHPRITDPRSA